MKRRERPVEEISYARGFFLVSLALLLVLAWSVYDETVTRRPWKAYQKKFMALEQDRLSKAIAECERALKAPETQKELARLENELAAARERLKSPDFEKAVKDLDRAAADQEEVQRNLTFLKSERDEAYYFWNRDRGKPGEDGAKRARYKKRSEQVAAAEKEVAAAAARVLVAQAKVDEFSAPVSELTSRREELTQGCDQLTARKQVLVRQGVGVKQIVVPELSAIDRCATCHLAIERPGDDGPEIPQPFRTHPALNTLLGKVHPVQNFGCTVCHRGQGPLIKGIGRKPFDHGREDHYWEKPLLKKPFTESCCRACHPEEWELTGGPNYSRGRRLFADYACYACHLTSGFEKSRRIGPGLLALRAKVQPEWLRAWLRRPRDLRPLTRMPNPWPTAVDRKGATRTGSPEVKVREDEIQAIAAFLLDASTSQLPVPLEPVPAADLERGRKLFLDKGCVGCHRPKDLNLPPLPSPERERDYGPGLDDLAGKLTGRDWLVAFLANPRAFFPETRMPNQELTLSERANLAAFLFSLDAKLQPQASSLKPQASSPPALIKRGRELVSVYGCYGCHELKSFENAARAGSDLDGFGDKPATQLSFGDTVRNPKAQTWENWTRLKLARPHLFATERIALRMPDHELPPDEIEPLAVFLLSLRSEKIPLTYARVLDELERGEALGARLIVENNCRGCHVMDGQGGDARQVIPDPGLMPPDLTGEGAKVQPAWLFQFLKRPEVLRPWMAMRMPNFSFSDESAELLVGYFMARAKKKERFVEVPVAMPPELKAQTAQAFLTLKCLQCHQLKLGPELKYSDLAPDMALTQRRLRPDWMESFILNPQGLQPGTRMPTYFPLEDDEDPESLTTPLPQWLNGDTRAQIRALRDFLFLLRSQNDILVSSPAPGRPP